MTNPELLEVGDLLLEEFHHPVPGFSYSRTYRVNRVTKTRAMIVPIRDLGEREVGLCREQYMGGWRQPGKDTWAPRSRFVRATPERIQENLDNARRANAWTALQKALTPQSSWAKVPVEAMEAVVRALALVKENTQ